MSVKEELVKRAIDRFCMYLNSFEEITWIEVQVLLYHTVCEVLYEIRDEIKEGEKDNGRISE